MPLITPLTSRRFLAMDLLSLTILLAIFYTVWLGHYPLFTPDEGRYAEVAREMLAGGDFITPRVDGVVFLDKPVLYYWLAATAIKLFGVTEWAIRLFPALFGILGCLATYLCGRSLFDRRSGLLSAIVLATSPLYFGSGHYANLDLEVAVWISCTLLFFITAIQSEDKTRHYFLFAAYMFAACGVLTKGLIGIVLPCMIVGTWIILLKRFDVLKKIHLFPGSMLFFVIVLPWYTLVQQANPQFFHYFFITQHVIRFFSGQVFNNPSPSWFYIPVILAGFFPWTSFLVQGVNEILPNVWKNRQQHATELFLLLWIIIILIFFSIPRPKMISYILPIFPALALFIGHYLSLQWEKVTQNNLHFSLILFCLFSIILTLLLVLLPYYQWMELASGITPYLNLIAFIVISSALAAVFLQKKRIIAFFMICVVLSTSTLLLLTHGASYLNQTSAKPLVTELKSIIKPQDEVITYFKYYQDLPLYLGRRVAIVAHWDAEDIVNKDNWVRELWYGMMFQKEKDWLMSEITFWERFNSNRRVFVFVNANYFDQFKSHVTSYFYLGRQNDIIMLSNQPTVLTENP